MLNDSSEILSSPAETWSAEITDCELLSQHNHIALYRIKQYGQWFVLKSLMQGTEQEQQRLQKEFQLAIRLNHPHIVRTFDFGHNERFGTYIRMEWLDAVTLSDFMATNPNRATRLRLLISYWMPLSTCTPNKSCIAT